MNPHLIETDHVVISFFKRSFIPVARFSLAIIFIWFGMLKVVGLSPASGLVHDLFNATIHFMNFDAFYMIFAWFEVIIGVLFLIPHLTRFVIPLLFIHLITTAGPLVMLPHETWAGFLIPTLVGQYIIKNLLIVATAIGIAAHVRPMK